MFLHLLGVQSEIRVRFPQILTELEWNKLRLTLFDLFACDLEEGEAIPSLPSNALRHKIAEAKNLINFSPNRLLVYVFDVNFNEASDFSCSFP